MLVVNNEVRFPLYRRFDGVGILDVGNVCERVSDVNLSLRKTAGVGLRMRTRFLLLRADFGLKLDRRTAERRTGFSVRAQFLPA